MSGFFSDPDTYMVVGGWGKTVEFVKLGTVEDSTCSKPPDLDIDPALKLTFAASTYVGGKILVCGGEFSKKCFNYDIANKVWAQDSQSLSVKRAEAGNFVMNGKWYILGGTPGEDGLDVPHDTSDVLTFSGQSYSFQAGDTLPYPSKGPCSVPIDSTRFFFSGGQEFKAYGRRKNAYVVTVGSTSSWTWDRQDDLPSVSTNSACGKMDNKIVITGGSGTTTKTQIFDLGTRKWSYGPSPPGGSLYENNEIIQTGNTLIILGASSGYDIFEFHGETSRWLKHKKRIALGRFQNSVMAVPNSALTTCP